MSDTLVNDNPWYINSSSKARLQWVTPSPEHQVTYIARVTSKDQSNPNISRLLKYCAKHKHWSVFEHAYMSVEIVTPLAIAIQILRHRSFCYQQFSGRYENQSEMSRFTDGLNAHLGMFYLPEIARLQDTKNRQNSIVSDDDDLTRRMSKVMIDGYNYAIARYNDLIEMGIAKEQARFMLPEGVYTRMYMTGSARSFIHYCSVREEKGVVQEEHVEVATAVKQIFGEHYPTVYDALFSEDKTDKDEEIAKLRLEVAELKRLAQLTDR